jgi:hypothetical protein
MRTKSALIAAAIIAVTLTTATASAAQGLPRIELGSSLVNLLLVKPASGGRTETLFGVPSGTFGIGEPGVYATLFANEYVGIEPQLTLFVASGAGGTNHMVNFAGQIDYFTKGIRESSPFVFASIGIVDISGSSTHPKMIGVGLGYRAVMGGRLAVRFDGRYSHVTDNAGNMVGLTASIGGLFGQ